MQVLRQERYYDGEAFRGRRRSCFLQRARGGGAARGGGISFNEARFRARPRWPGDRAAGCATASTLHTQARARTAPSFSAQLAVRGPLLEASSATHSVPS